MRWPRLEARGVALALLLGLALASAGCGGAGADSQATGSASATTGAGGEKSIERFGVAAEGAERTALVDAFRAYAKALAGGDYAAACSHLAAATRRSLERIAPARMGRRRCVVGISALLGPRPVAELRGQAEGRITRARVTGRQAFVIYHAPGAELYEMPMVRENGGWKAALLLGSVLVPDPVASR